MIKKIHTLSGCAVLRRLSMLLMVAACVASMQAATTVTSFTDATNAGTVHEDLNVLYRNPGDVLLTYRNQAFTSYTRWFNYLDGRKVNEITTTATDYAEADAYGLFVKSNVHYNYPGTAVVRIGCDQSKYGNGRGFGTATIVAPTLSQRIVYEIHPASEMAEKVDAYEASLNAGYMENYNIIAPAGNNVYIGPKYAYTNSGDEVYPNYYYNTAAPVQMAAIGGASTPSETVISTVYNYTNTNGNAVTSTSVPADNAMEYTYQSGIFNPNYTATYTKVEHIRKSTTTTAGGWVWMADGAVIAADQNPLSGQFILVSSAVDIVEYTLVYNAGGSRTVVVEYDKTTTYTVTRTRNNNKYKYSTDNGTSANGAETQITDTSNGESKTYNIAKFTVDFRSKDEVGPKADYADPSYLTGTDTLAYQNFNFNKPGNVNAWYSTPLGAGESTYGFSNHDIKNGDAGYNEYTFNNYGRGWSSYSDGTYSNHDYLPSEPGHTDKSKGYALYCDGSQKAGKVFSINFNANLCPGATMYFSAWVGDHNKGNKTLPILEFVVVGVRKVNGVEVEDELVTFSSGEMTDVVKWNRILFPLDFNTVENYHHYNLRVINKAAGVDGNDFWLDDIYIYLKPAPLQPIEASSASECLNEDSPLTLYTRIDYAQANEATTGATPLYYRWLDYEGETIVTDKYFGATNDNKNGYISLNQNYLSIPAEDQMSSFAAFDEEYRITPTPVAKYIYETGLTPLNNGNTNRYVLYLATPIEVKLGNQYTCVIANSVAELASANNCSQAADITVSNGMRINSVAGGGMVKGLQKQICANYSYDLSVLMEYSVLMGNTTKRDTSEYVAHWLFGLPKDVDDDYEANGKTGLYGANFATVQAAIEAYGKSGVSQAQTDLVNRLVQKGLLTLGKVTRDADGKVVKAESDITYFVMPLNGETELSYTAFPIAKVKDNAPDCSTPQSITLYFPKGNDQPDRNVITFVKSYGEKVPTFVSARPRRVRIIEGTETQNVKIELSNTGKTYKLGAVSLFKTDDATYNGPIPHCDSHNNVPVTGTDLSVDFDNLGYLKAGHSYTFKVRYNLAEGEDISHACLDDENADLHDGEAFITFLIVPELLTFTAGDDITAAWNDDYNWTYDNNGSDMVTFVPLKETSVIFQTGDHILMNPVAVDEEIAAKERLQEAAVEEKALPYITYDINYEPYTCRRVFVPAQTTIVNQHNIVSTDAWQFDMPVVPNQWNMTAMPIHGVVSGDMFIPYNEKEGDESKGTPFTVDNIYQQDGYAADRLEYGFYNSMFNSAEYHTELNGRHIDLTTTGWSLATNSLTTPLDNARAWSLGVDVADDTTKTYVMRLPKDETWYSYFRTEWWIPGVMKETELNRGDSYGRPIMDEAEKEFTLTNNAEGTTFIFGNPTFAYIDLVEFYKENKDKIQNTFVLSGVSNSIEGYSHNTASVTEAGGEWIATTEGNAGRYLAPMTGVMVEAKDNGTTLNLKLTPSMLVTSDGKREAKATTNNVMAAPGVRRELRISAAAAGFVSRALIVENEGAHAEALDGEDAGVVLLDDAKTPFAIYTLAGDKPLAINNTPADETIAIPLAMVSQRPIGSEVLTFTGDDSFLSEWDLIDNLTGRREQLSDGFQKAVMMITDGVARYYLEHSRHYAPSTTTSIEDTYGIDFKTYAIDGVLTVYSSEDMHNFCIYDAAGRTISSAQNAGRLQQLNLSTGIYMVQANGKTQKVIVK